MLASSASDMATKALVEKFLHLCAGASLFLTFYLFFSEEVKAHILGVNRADFTYVSMVIILLTSTFLAYAIGMGASSIISWFKSTADYRKYRKIVASFTDEEVFRVHALTYKLFVTNNCDVDADRIWIDFKNLLINDLLEVSPSREVDMVNIRLRQIDIFLKNNPEFSTSYLLPKCEEVINRGIKNRRDLGLSQ